MKFDLTADQVMQAIETADKESHPDFWDIARFVFKLAYDNGALEELAAETANAELMIICGGDAHTDPDDAAQQIVDYLDHRNNIDAAEAFEEKYGRKCQCDSDPPDIAWRPVA